MPAIIESHYPFVIFLLPPELGLCMAIPQGQSALQQMYRLLSIDLKNLLQ
jgi:hypothetical protein